MSWASIGSLRRYAHILFTQCEIKSFKVGKPRFRMDWVIPAIMPMEGVGTRKKVINIPATLLAKEPCGARAHLM